MGKRGPAPTPTPILRLRGSWRGDANGAEPQPEPGRPEKPDWLKGYAETAWEQFADQLEAMGVLTVADGHALTVLCQTWSRWRRAEEFVDQHGETYPVQDNQGRVRYLKKFPQVGIAQACATTLNRMMAEFGLTPSARSRIVVPSDKASDDEDKRRYLAG